MYPVSEAYRKAVNQNTRTDRIQIEMLRKDLSAHCVLTDAEVESGTLVVSKRCVNHDYFEFGAAYAGELQFQSRSEKISYLSLVGWYARVTYQLRLADDTWESVPVGVYRVTECSYAKDLCKITAYDCLVLLDWEVPYLATSGNSPYQMLSMSLDIVTNVEILYGLTIPQVTLGNSKAEIEALPNGTIPLPTTDQIQTPRECISAVAELLGCYVEADRVTPNQIRLRRFRPETVSQTIAPSVRFQYDINIDWDRPRDVSAQIAYRDDGSKRSGFTYTAKGSGTFALTGGYRMLLENKILQQLGETNAKKIVDNLAAELSRINQTEYLPISFSFFGDPALDVGDMVTCIYNGTQHPMLAGATVWNYRNAEQVTAVGGNKTTDISQSKSGLKNETKSTGTEDSSAAGMQYYPYTNTDRIVISDGGEADIAAIRALSYRATTVVFLAEVRLQVATTESTVNGVYTCTDGSIEAAYCIGKTEIGSIRPQWTLQDGVHTIHLFHSFRMTGYDAIDFRVKLLASGCTVTIQPQFVQALLEGSYLAGQEAWDGLLQVADKVGITIGSTVMQTSPLTTQAEVPAAEVQHCRVADTVGIAIGGTAVQVSGIADTIQTEITEAEEEA